MSMREQLSLMRTGFERKIKLTRRTEFLLQMDELLPWKRLYNIVKNVYYKGEGAGRPPIALERMLRIYFLQLWFNLSDPAMEESLYDSDSMRAFAMIDLGATGVPDETTICKFRHLLEEHEVGKKLFKEVNAYLTERHIKVGTGTIVDATIIQAPSSTKNERGERDPEMHSTKKGNQYYFGMKAHIGVDSRTKVVHSLVTTAANTHDSVVVDALLHGNERRVYGDSAYAGKEAAILGKARDAQLFINQRSYCNRPLSDLEKRRNRWKSSIRARVEHQFGVIKGVFGFRKVRYKGLEKNTNLLYVLFALANVFVCKKRLLMTTG
jgi:transposase, IS5 family